jgi:hypothetical protein
MVPSSHSCCFLLFGLPGRGIRPDDEAMSTPALADAGSSMTRESTIMTSKVSLTNIIVNGFLARIPVDLILCSQAIHGGFQILNRIRLNLAV